MSGSLGSGLFNNEGWIRLSLNYSILSTDNINAPPDLMELLTVCTSVIPAVKPIYNAHASLSFSLTFAYSQ